MDRYIAALAAPITAPYRWMRDTFNALNIQPAAGHVERPESRSPSATVHTPSSSSRHSSQSERILTPESSPEPPASPFSPLPPIRKSKRKRNADETGEFIAMLIEAVDRDSAKQQLEEQVNEIEANLVENVTYIASRKCRIRRLSSWLAQEPALESGMRKCREERDSHREEKRKLVKKRYLLKQRLKQSDDQLRVLLREIYQASDSFLHSLGSSGEIPVFKDDSGNMCEGLIWPLLLSTWFRDTADCAADLDLHKSQVQRKRVKFTKASKSAREPSSMEQQARRRDQRTAILRQWTEEADVYATDRKAQEQREQKLLRDELRPFLIEAGLMRIPREPSEISSPGPDEPPRTETDDCANEVSPENMELYQELVEARDAIRTTVRRIETNEQQAAASCVEWLYGYPNGTVEDLNAKDAELMGEHPDAIMNRHRESLQDWKNWYAQLQWQARGTEIEPLLLLPGWTESDDVLSEASYFGPPESPKRLKRRRRNIERRITLEDQYDTPSSAADAQNLRFSPPAYAALPSPHILEGAYGLSGTELSDASIKRRLRKLRPHEYTETGDFIPVNHDGST